MSSMWELWLNHTREKPWRSFLYLWLTLMVLFILIGIFGFRHDTFPETPPLPESFTYQSFIDQLKISGKWKLDIDPDLIPTYDPTIKYEGITDPSPYVHYKEDGKLLLTWQRRTIDGSFGWPLPIVDWYSQTVWDVTDPAEPYTLADGHWSSSSWFDLGKDFAPTIRKASSNYTRISIIRFRAFVFLSVAMSLEIVSAAFVWLTWIIVYRRRKRRLHKNACLKCGHLSGPEPKPLKCPECGCEVDKSVKLNTRRSRFGWLFICLLLFCFVYTILASIFLIDQYPQKPIAEQMKSLREAEEAARLQNNTKWRSITHFDGAIGFPVLFAKVSRKQYFIVPPGKKPYSGIPSYVSTGFSVSYNADRIKWTFPYGAPGYLTTITIPWKAVIVQIGVTQLFVFILALILTVITWPVRRLLRKRAAVSGSS